jgi:hypothetical protein
MTHTQTCYFNVLLYLASPLLINCENTSVPLEVVVGLEVVVVVIVVAVIVVAVVVVIIKFGTFSFVYKCRTNE